MPHKILANNRVNCFHFPMPWRLRARASEGARESGGAGERETSKVEASERGVAIEQARKLENPIARDGVVSAMQRRETAVDLARLCSRRCVGRRERGRVILQSYSYKACMLRVMPNFASGLHEEVLMLPQMHALMYAACQCRQDM